MSKTTNILLSADGSHTLMSDKFDVTYHSKHGAINESMTVFIEAGYNFPDLKNTDPLHIFEMGFGTGLNPLLTLIKANSDKRNVVYSGIEAYPITTSIVQDLNYVSILESPYHTEFGLMHGADTTQSISNLPLSPNFTFNKIIGKLEEMPMTEQYHIIYFDAFAPSSQPELWTTEILSKLFKATKQGGVLVTYCAKGSFKRALKSVGYQIEALPGPTGKREMTRAIKI